MDKIGITSTFASPTSQLNTEDIWKRMVYLHYQLNATTPSLPVRSELGSFPTYISGITRLANYMAHGPHLWSLRQLWFKKPKFSWWNNSWRLLDPLNITLVNILSTNSQGIKEDLKGQYCRWWLQQFSDPSSLPKLRTFRLFKTSFAPSEYLNEGPSYFRTADLRFRCSNHRLDIELLNIIAFVSFYP